jgi:hypothetical protein
MPRTLIFHTPSPQIAKQSNSNNKAILRMYAFSIFGQTVEHFSLSAVPQGDLTARAS